MRKEALASLRDGDRAFDLEIFYEDGGDVLEGRLHGKEGVFPILEGVPRIVTDGRTRSEIRRRFQAFHYSPGTTLFEGPETHLPVNSWKTVRGFGDEWERFSALHSDYDVIVKDYFQIVPDEALRGKKILDLGCGMGRWAEYVADRAHEVWAVDLSFAVDAARVNLGKKSNVHLLQADIMSLPLSQDSFDFVYSLGVLHHLADTQQGFEAIVRYCRHRGKTLVYVYYNLENRGRLYRQLFAVSNIVRKATSGMPRFLFRPLAMVMACATYSSFVLPSKLVQAVGRKELSRSMPLGYYADKSFYTLYLDTVDRFGTVIENRHSLAEIEEWHHQAGCKVLSVSDRPPYWCVLGQRV